MLIGRGEDGSTRLTTTTQAQKTPESQQRETCRFGNAIHFFHDTIRGEDPVEELQLIDQAAAMEANDMTAR